MVDKALVVLNGPAIAAGESLSDVLDCTSGVPCRITMPADWTSAILTFQISTDGQGFNDLVQPDGHEVQFNVVPGSAVMVPADSSNFNYIKFRSGSRDNPIPQPERRQFAMAVAQSGTPVARSAATKSKKIPSRKSKKKRR